MKISKKTLLEKIGFNQTRAPIIKPPMRRVGRVLPIRPENNTNNSIGLMPYDPSIPLDANGYPMSPAEVTKQFKSTPQRFVPVTQDDGSTKIQDLYHLMPTTRTVVGTSYKPVEYPSLDKTMTTRDIMVQSDALGAQARDTIDYMNRFRAADTRDSLEKFRQRYGENKATEVVNRGKEEARKMMDQINQNIQKTRESPEYRQKISDEANRRVDARLSPENIAVSKEVGFDAAASRSRTSDVLAQSERAERMYNAAKEKRNKLFGDS